MSDTNLVILNGRLCDNAEFTPSEKKVFVKFRLATSYSYLDGKGERVERTEFHNVRTSITALQLPVWKDRLLKGRRMQVTGSNATDIVQRESGEKSYYHFVRVFSNDVTLPEPVSKPQETSAPAPEESSGRLSTLERPPVAQAPGSLRGREDALNF